MKDLAGQGLLTQREIKERNKARWKKPDQHIVTNAGTHIIVKHDGRNFTAWRVEGSGELTNMHKGSGKDEPLIEYLMRTC